MLPNVNIICVLGFAVHLIGRVNKTCQGSPGAAAVPAEQSVLPAGAREEIVVFWRGEEKDGPSGYFSHTSRVRRRLAGRKGRQIQTEGLVCFLTADHVTQTDTESHFNT